MRRVVATILASTLISILLLTAAFALITNLNRFDTVQDTLGTANETIRRYLREHEEEGWMLESMDPAIRVTLIASDGEVLFDSSNRPSYENHLLRKEVQEALEKGVGTDVRSSDTVGVQLVYRAEMLEDGRIIRTAMDAGTLSLGAWFTAYMSIGVFIVLLISLIIALKISSYVVDPIRELSFATNRIAGGDYVRRLPLRKDPELNQLALNFNHMAEKLERTYLENEEKQGRLEAILRSMNSGVFAFDNQQNILLINPFCKQIFGIYGDVIGRNLSEINEFEPVMDLVRSEVDMLEVQIKRPVHKDIRIKSAEILGERGNRVGTVVVLQDITDLKKLEKIRSQFVANVSHELKTPLTSIKGFSETLRYVGDEETRNKFLDIINEESERLTRLIEDILTLSSIEQQMELKHEAFEVVGETWKMHSLLEPLAESKGVKLLLEAEGEIWMQGDKDHYRQLIMNLVDNAIKYTKAEGRVTVALTNEWDKVKIVVEDTGIGIPRKHLSRLFERFYRVDKSRDRALGGTGLGLAIVKHIVLLFSGTIDVESEIGVGTRFTVVLPVKASSKRSAGN